MSTLIVPESAAPSGGDVYDRRLAEELTALGHPVRVAALPGAWPDPCADDRTGLARALAALPEHSTVLVDGLVACGVPEVLAPHRHRLRLVVLVHLPLALEGGLTGARARDRDARERRALSVAHRVVATSDWARRHLAERHGLPDVVAIAPGTDPAAPAPGTDGRSHLVCVASLTPRKGHEVLLRALSLLPGAQWRLTCVGPGRGGHAARLRDMARERGWQGRVRFTGALTGARLERAWSGADLCVLASRAETYGMAVTEALARGVPVVATDVGGVPEALGWTEEGARPGLLVPPGDPEALAGALLRWWREPRLRRCLRRSARLRGETLAGWDRTARAAAAVLDPERWP